MTTEPPRPDQIQANVAAALSRLRGELAPTAPVPNAASAEPPAGTQSGAEAPPVAAPSVAAPSVAAPSVAASVGQHGPASSEPHFGVGPSLNAPDPSMALNPSKPVGEGADTPFARIAGLAATEQPDLLAGIGAPPLADISEAEMEAARQRRRLRNRLLAGGVLVLALAGFWVWSGGGETGNEPVPVIAADSTPEKVKPADEGGLEVPNQDVAILNGENSTAPAEGETVLPAPEQPATPPAPPEPAPAAEAAPATDAGNAIPSVPAPSVDAIPSVPAPAEPSAATGEAAPAEAAPVPAESQTAAADATPAASEAAPAETAAAPTAQPAAAGAARIQLAAVKSKAAAQKEWVRIQKAHPDLLGALSLHVERFNKSATETYYRIQAGPLADKAAAKQLCAKLKEQNQACLVAN